MTSILKTRRIASHVTAFAVAVGFAAGLATHPTVSVAGETAVIIPAPMLDESPKTGGLEKAIFAGGCFWGVQGVFQRVNGVENAVSGYAGGDKQDPTYNQVSSGSTGHAEAVEVTYDPSKVSYGKLLQIFFSVAHNPTQLNYQGPDKGTQYRSAIFTTSDEQKKVAEAYIAELDKTGKFDAKIVTEVAPAPTFYAAEDYHQDYATLHPDQPYIVYWDLPKIENLKKTFPEVWREQPKLVFPANAS
jgi:peptide-methionine (S)-S-oxide reductase